MDKSDIRWKQRFSNFEKAFKQLENAVDLAKTRKLSKLEQQGLIQSFEYTHELAWKVMKDYFIYQGNPEITGSRDATRESFNVGLIEEGEVWMDMIKSRNLTSHTYNEEIAEEIAKYITEAYIEAFSQFRNKMRKIEENEQ